MGAWNAFARSRACQGIFRLREKGDGVRMDAKVEIWEGSILVTFK